MLAVRILGAATCGALVLAGQALAQEDVPAARPENRQYSPYPEQVLLVPAPR